MQSINTKYLAPTNTRGARIKAYASYAKELSVTIGYDYSLHTEAAHAKAAMELAQTLKWGSDWYSADSENGKGYVFVPCANHNKWIFYHSEA